MRRWARLKRPDANGELLRQLDPCICRTPVRIATGCSNRHAIRATASDPEAAEICGVDARQALRAAAAIAVTLAALAGVFLAMQGQDTPYSGPAQLLFAFEVVVIGGIILGPVMGAVLLFALQELFGDFGAWYLAGIGAVAILFALNAPQGIIGLLHDRTGMDPLSARKLWVGRLS